MPKDLLTDAKIRTAKPADAAYKLGDGGGLSLLVNETGSRLWRLKFRLGGKEGLFSIGAYPAVGLADARAAQDAAKELIRCGNWGRTLAGAWATTSTISGRRPV